MSSSSSSSQHHTSKSETVTTNIPDDADFTCPLDGNCEVEEVSKEQVDELWKLLEDQIQDVVETQQQIHRVQELLQQVQAAVSHSPNTTTTTNTSASISATNK